MTDKTLSQTFYSVVIFNYFIPLGAVGKGCSDKFCQSRLNFDTFSNDFIF